MENKIPVLLVDDHSYLLEGIKAILSGNGRFEVVAETTDPTQVLDLLNGIPISMVITDMQMPNLNGLELTRLVKARFPQIKVLALSMSGDAPTVREMLGAGISGYVLKNTGKTELLEAMDRVAGGGMYFSQEVSTELLKPIIEKAKIPPTEEEIRLTTRETEIVKLIAAELSNQEIGEKLFISERTVETHRKNIFHKTKTKSVAGLIQFAIRAGIVS